MSGIGGIATAAGARALFSKAASNALSDARSVGGWLSRRRPIELLCMALALALLVQHVVDRRHASRIESKLATCSKDLADTKSAFDTTVANYRAAAADAEAKDKANADRVRLEQSKINQESSDAYEARIADARAAAQRVRDRLAQAATNPGGGAAAPVSGVPSTASLVDSVAEQDRFSLADRLTATEQAIQLDELIKWVKKQAGVDVNGNPPPPKAVPAKKRKHFLFF